MVVVYLKLLSNLNMYDIFTKKKKVLLECVCVYGCSLNTITPMWPKNTKILLWSLIVKKG